MRKQKMLTRPLAALLALVMALTLAPAASAEGRTCPKCNATCVETVIKEANCHEEGAAKYVCPNGDYSVVLALDIDPNHHDMIYTNNGDGTHSGVCRHNEYHAVAYRIEQESHANFYNASGVCERCGALNYSQVSMSLPERRTVPVALGDTAAKLSAGDVKLSLGSADITGEYKLSYVWFYQGAQVATGAEYALPSSIYTREGIYYYTLIVSAVPTGTLHRQTVTKTCDITVQVKELITASAVVTTLDGALRLGDGDGWSAEPVSSQIYAAVLALCGRDASPSYVRFDELPSDSVGKLSVTKTSDTFFFSGVTSLLDDVQFLPGGSAGEFLVRFTAYDNANKSYDGVLTITVQQYAGDMDVVYITPRNAAVTLDAKDFQAFWQRISPDGTLDYITFDELPTSVEGVLYAGYTSAALPGEQVWRSDLLYVQPGLGQYGINSVAFIPGVTQNGYVTLPFTAYGSRADRDISRKGVIYVFLTNVGHSADVSVAAAAAGTALAPAEFQKAYQSATGETGAGFYIQLMEVPSSGSLYVNRTAGKQGTRLTAAALRGRSFACGSAQGETISSLTYVPGSAAKETVRYVANSIQGKPLYAGTITFTSSGASATASMVVPYNATSAGVNFRAVDFEGLPGADANKLSMVSFTPPASTVGTLYYGKTTTATGTVITSGNEWFSVSSSANTGANSMNSVTFVPAAGSSGTVTIPFTAIDTSASRVTGSVQITILSSTGTPGTTTTRPVKTFPDVPVGEWYYTYVTDLATSGVLGGYEDGTFRPSEGVTLGQALKMVMTAAGYPEQAPTDKHWASGYLAKAEADHLLPSTLPRTLDRRINRYDIAIIAANAMRLTPVAVTASPFSDMEVTASAAPYVMALYNIGVFTGSEDDVTHTLVFQGNLGIRRREFAAVIWRVQNYVKTGNANGNAAG